MAPQVPDDKPTALTSFHFFYQVKRNIFHLGYVLPSNVELTSDGLHKLGQKAALAETPLALFAHSMFLDLERNRQRPRGDRKNARTCTAY